MKMEPMKLLPVLAAILGVSLACARAQTPPPAAKVPSPPTAVAVRHETDPLQDLPQVQLDRAERLIYFQTNLLSRMFGVDMHYTGVLPQLRRTDRPLQLLNPFAPSDFGDGMDPVVLNPAIRRAEGIVIFAIRF
jgi:hypothetical protein